MISDTDKSKQSPIHDVITRLDSLNVGDTYKYAPNDVGIFKVLAKDEENWVKTVRTQSGRITGGFPWTKVYPVNE